MEKTLRTRTGTLLAAVALLAAMAVALAFSAEEAQAAELASAKTSAKAALTSPESSLATQALKNVWVISKMHTTQNDDPYTRKCSYTSNGLLKKDFTTTYAYDKQNRCKYKIAYGQKTEFTFDSLGRVSKSDNSKYVYDSKGRLAKYIFANGTMLRKYTYDKKGRLIKAVGHGGQGVETYKFTYDSNNQVKSFTSTEEGGKVKVTNTYKNGLLVKQKVQTPHSGTWTCTYSYKKIAIPKSFVARVQAQQRTYYLKSLTYFAPQLEGAYK